MTKREWTAKVQGNVIKIDTMGAVMTLAILRAAIKWFRAGFGLAPKIEIRGRWAGEAIRFGAQTGVDVLDLTPATFPDRRYRARIDPARPALNVDDVWIDVYPDARCETVKLAEGTGVEVFFCL